MRFAKLMFILVLALVPLAAAQADQGDGLMPNADALRWSRWQGRMAIGTLSPVWRAELGGPDRQGLKPRSLSLMGDYLFARSMAADGSATVFRATSGLVLGPRPTLWIGQPGALTTGAFGVEQHAVGDPAADSSALPYLGVGYSGLSGRGGWSFSADFGLVARAGNNVVRLGRVLGGAQGLDDMVRDLRLAPVMQLGASYSF